MKYKVYASTPEYAFKRWREFVDEMQLVNYKLVLLKVKRKDCHNIFIFSYKQKKIKPVQVVIDINGKARGITTLRSYTIGFFNGLFIGLIVGFIFLFILETRG